MIDPAAGLALRGALGLLLVSSAVHKLRDPAGFREALAGYALVPTPALAPAAALVVAAELSIGGCLWLPGAGALPALAAATLLGVYTSAIALNLARGRRDIDCGCAAPGARRPLGTGLVVRNVGLVALALAAALPVLGRAFTWVDGVTVAGGIGVAALLYLAGDGLLARAADFSVAPRAGGAS